MAITKSKGRYFTDVERVWEESLQLGRAPYFVGQWTGKFKLPDRPTPEVLRPLFDGAVLPRVQHNRVGCFDVTFTASKSVSVVLYALTPPAGWARSAQLVAKAAAAQVEPLLAGLKVNAGAQGATKVPASGTAAVFPHFRSSAGAPHAHVHFAVPNVAVTADGKAGSIANAKLLYDEHGACRAGFQKDLDDHFQRRGYQTARVGKATEVVGVPAGLLAELSPARAAIEEARRATGFSGARAADFFARQARRDVPPGPEKSVDGYHAEWSSAARRYGVTRESLRIRDGQPLIGDRRVRRYTAYCTARDALKRCTKRHGAFTAAQFREATYLMGIGRPTTRKDLDKEIARVLARPKYAGVHRKGPDAADARYSTRAGARKRQTAEQKYSSLGFDELRGATGTLAKSLLLKVASATRAVRALAALKEHAPTVLRIDGREIDSLLSALTPTGYLKAHGRALLKGLLAPGNPHERALVAEREYERLRAHRRLPAGCVVVVARSHALSTRQLTRLSALAKRDRASVVLSGFVTPDRGRPGHKPLGPHRECDRRG